MIAESRLAALLPTGPVIPAGPLFLIRKQDGSGAEGILVLVGPERVWVEGIGEVELVPFVDHANAPKDDVVGWRIRGGPEGFRGWIGGKRADSRPGVFVGHTGTSRVRRVSGKVRETRTEDPSDSALARCAALTLWAWLAL